MGAGSHSKTSVKSNPRQPSDDGSSAACEPCQEQGQGRVRISVSFCVQCRQFCCQICAENHRKFKGTQTHQLASMVSEGGPRRLNTQIFACDRCSNHAHLGKPNVFVVCRDCKQLLCKSCIGIHDNDANLKSHKMLTLAAFAREPIPGGNDFRRRDEKPLAHHVASDNNKFECKPNNKARKSSHSITATCRGEVKVSITSDKYTANIYDVSTTSDCKLVVIDDRNSKVKVFTPDHKLHSSLSLAYLPGNVTCINDGMIAMATGNEILYFKLKGTKLSQMSHKLPLKGEITGIVKNVNTLAVTYEMYGSQSRIGIINSKGTEKELNKTEQISTSPMERWGRITIFKNSRDSTFNVVVLEDDSGTLGCFDNKGQRAWTCLIPQAGNWQGGVSTKMGGIAAVADVILVTDVINHVIHVVTEIGEYGGILLDQTDGLHRPYAICYNNKGRLLYVTQFRSDNVKIFNIK